MHDDVGLSLSEEHEFRFQLSFQIIDVFHFHPLKDKGHENTQSEVMGSQGSGIQSIYCKKYPGGEKVVPFLWQASEGH